MEHEKLPGEHEGERIEWWMILLLGLLNLYAIASGSTFWLLLTLYMNFSVIVCREEGDD